MKSGQNSTTNLVSGDFWYHHGGTRHGVVGVTSLQMHATIERGRYAWQLSNIIVNKTDGERRLGFWSLRATGVETAGFPGQRVSKGLFWIWDTQPILPCTMPHCDDSVARRMYKAIIVVIIRMTRQPLKNCSLTNETRLDCLVSIFSTSNYYDLQQHFRDILIRTQDTLCVEYNTNIIRRDKRHFDSYKIRRNVSLNWKS